MGPFFRLSVSFKKRTDNPSVGYRRQLPLHKGAMG